MRRASFKHTQEQMRVGAAAARASADGYSSDGKDVTRRLGWPWAKSGMYLLAMEKCQGIRKGQQVEVFGVIEILAVKPEPLYDIVTRHGPMETAREGFPDLTAPMFVSMFCEHMDADPSSVVTRVVFRHVDFRRVRSAWHALTEAQACSLRFTGMGGQDA